MYWRKIEMMNPGQDHRATVLANVASFTTGSGVRLIHACWIFKM